MNTEEIRKALRAGFDKRQHDPVELGRWLFDSSYWSKQEAIMRSVWEHKKTAVRSCNSGGKSRIASEIGLLYLLKFRPSRVITTAPTFTQVEEILWKEIHSLYSKSRIPFNGHITSTELDMGIYNNHPWQMIGISTNEENRMQGFKSPHLLVILDEALGIDPIIWRAIEGLLPHRILAIGNPLDPVGDFFNCFSNSQWNTIHIDGLECVEWQEKHGKIPGLITREWINERKDEWGEKSPMYQSRVLGEFPQDSESSVIQRSWVDRARQLEIEIDEQFDDKIESCDLASKHGKNNTVFTERTGNVIFRCTPYPEMGPLKAVNRLIFDYGQKQLDTIIFDADGLGEGWDEFIEAKNIPYIAFHGGYSYKAIDTRKFKNLRTQFYCLLAKKFEKGLISLKHLPQKEYEILKNQLCAINYKACDGMGRIQIETKEDLQVRQIQSPDSADSVMMSEFALWTGRMGDIKEYSYR